MMTFRKKLTKDEAAVLLHDLESMIIILDLGNNEYHYNLLRNNIKDLGGLSE